MSELPYIEWETGSVEISWVMQLSLTFKQDPVASIHLAHQLMSLLNTMERVHWAGQRVNSPLLRRHPVLYRVANKLLTNKLLKGLGYSLLQDFREAATTLSCYLSGPLAHTVTDIERPPYRTETGRFHRLQGNQILMLVPSVSYGVYENTAEVNVDLLSRLGHAATVMRGMEGVVDIVWEGLSKLE